jgi:hypothetical protein
VQVLLTETDGQDAVVLGMGRAGQADGAQSDREQPDREQPDREQPDVGQSNPALTDAAGRGDKPGDNIPTQAAR